MTRILVFSNRHIPIKSHEDARHVLQESSRQGVNIAFELDEGYIAQFTPVQGGFEYLNCNRDSNELSRVVIVQDLETAVKYLYKLRKYFNRKLSE